MFSFKLFTLLYIANILYFMVKSQDVEKTETEVPGSPASMHVEVSSTSIVVSWSPPRDQNILVQGYVLGYGGMPDTYREFLNVDERSYTIRDLSEYGEEEKKATCQNLIFTC